MTSLALSSRRDIATRRRYPVAAFASASAIILAFLPYVALPLGGSTSVSLAGLVGVAAWAIGPRIHSLDLTVITVGLLPLLAMAFSALFFETGLPQSAALTWISAVGPFAAGATGVVCLRHRLSRLLGWLILGTSVFAIFQYFALRAGFIPFLELYHAPGYASVQANADAILLYIRRPFAQFPEPSFMAGSLALAILGMLLVSRFFGRKRLGLLEVIALIAGSIAIVMSESGSAVMGLGAIAIALLASAVRTIGAQVRAVVLVILAVVGAVWVLEQRSSPLNFSWGDRLSSIQVSGQFWASDAASFFFGLGRGGMTAAYSQGRVDLAGFNFTQPPLDVFSVLGRILFESGLFVGGTIVVLLIVLIARAGNVLTAVFGLALVAAWIAVAGVTISYESAAMIWLLPGICLGVLVQRTRDTLP